jgi:drug/metabolite transporter (DMT)-like permease
MIELWIPYTIAGAFLQNLRSALQKHLKDRLTTLGATYVRFLYALPFALIYLLVLNVWVGKPYPALNLPFLIYVSLGSLTQIIFTALLIWLFSLRNFAVGTTFSKTEIVQVAILGLVILGDTISLVPALAIVVAAIGVMALSVGQAQISLASLSSALFEKPTLVGLATGAFLGASVVFFRGAALSLHHPDTTMAAAFALTVALLLQTLLMGVYLAFKEPRTIRDVIVHWPWSLAVGVAGVLASIAWFTAFTLQNAAYVRALGQVELVFTFIASIFFFRESTSRMEVVGILLVVAAILILILGR